MKIIRLIAILITAFITTICSGQTLFKTDRHFPVKPKDIDLAKAEATITDLMKDVKIYGGDIWGSPKDILTTDDRIEFTIKNQKRIISFSDILAETITVDEFSMSENNGPYILVRYEVRLLSYLLNFRMHYDHASQFANNLLFIQHGLVKKYFIKELELFKPVAEQYKSLKDKPVITEETRKFIVQANAFNEKKNYTEAFNMYIKAIMTDPISYPAAYSNLALLSAQVNEYERAVFYMKEYLMLVPDASDARSAQDKIYEWESEIPE